MKPWSRLLPGSCAVRRWGRFSLPLRARADDLRLALGALSGHKLRSGLTLLGIVIGVFTVVAMMALLNGLSKSINKQHGRPRRRRPSRSSAGRRCSSATSRRRWRRARSSPSPQFKALRDALPQAKQVGGEMWEYGKRSTPAATLDLGAQVAGGTPEFFTINNLPIASGRGFTEAEADDAARVAVIGATVVDALFPGADPLGQQDQAGAAWS